MVKKTIWISWENQRRNREVSAALNIQLFEFDEIDKLDNYLIKYILGIAKTISIFVKIKPRIIICQNPSIVLSFLSIIFKYTTGIKVVIDSHNSGIFPKNGRYKILNFLSRFIQRNADLTIVSNKNLKKHVENNGGKGFVLQDKIPDICRSEINALNGIENLLFICSFGDDEPYQLVIEAARRLKKDIFIYITGNYKKKIINIELVPHNVVFTGYLPECEYVKMLNSVDGTIDLTNRENCLVCGGYESTAAGKPMVLSKTRALMEYFNKGAVYVDHNIDSIAHGIKEVIRRKNELSEQITELKKIRTADWQVRKTELENILSGF